MMQRSTLPLFLFILSLIIVFAAPASAGTCNGGHSNGLFCFYHWECGAWCNGGPANHLTCFYDSDCGKTCAGGAAMGNSCFYNFECPGSFCKQWGCQKFSCAGGSAAFTEEKLMEEKLAAYSDSIFAPAQPSSE
jgi:hypothetical protein